MVSCVLPDPAFKFVPNNCLDDSTVTISPAGDVEIVRGANNSPNTANAGRRTRRSSQGNCTPSTDNGERMLIIYSYFLGPETI